MAGTLSMFDPLAANQCFADSLGNGLNQWTVTGAWDIVSLPGGGQALTDSPNGNYDSAAPGTGTMTTMVTSAAFALFATENITPSLTFQHDFVIAQIGDSQDVGRVEISTDDGATWTGLAAYSGGGVFDLETQTGTSPEWTNVNWQEVGLDLSPYAGHSAVRLRFSLTVDEQVSDKGWVIDNIQVTCGPALAPGTNPIFLPMILKSLVKGR